MNNQHDKKSGMKAYDELTFADDFMFCKIMENNPGICKEVIELILGKRIEIKTIRHQKPIEITPDGRGVRLDVVVEGDDTVYDLEMQNSHREELPRRSRYYQSVIDLDMMERGAKYNMLTDSVIIFLCRFDPFGLGRNIYTVKKHIEEAPEYAYNDGTEMLFLSSLPGQKGEISEDLRRFLDYVDGNDAHSNLTERIEKVSGK